MTKKYRMDAFIVLVFIAGMMPNAAHCQDSPIKAQLTLEGQAYNYGGFIFNLDVENTSNNTVLFYDPQDDTFLRMESEEGKVLLSMYTYRPLGEEIEIAPHSKYHTSFEVRLFYITALAFDNYGWGPTFLPGRYQVDDTLHFALANSRDDVKIMIVSTAVDIKNVSALELDMVDTYTRKYGKLCYDYMNTVCQNDVDADVIDFDVPYYYNKLGQFVDNCKNTAVYRRFLQSLIDFGILYLEVFPKELLAQYISMYPATPYTKHFASHFVTAEMPGWKKERLIRRNPITKIKERLSPLTSN